LPEGRREEKKERKSDSHFDFERGPISIEGAEEEVVPLFSGSTTTSPFIQ